MRVNIFVYCFHSHCISSPPSSKTKAFVQAYHNVGPWPLPSCSIRYLRRTVRASKLPAFRSCIPNAAIVSDTSSRPQDVTSSSSGPFRSLSIFGGAVLQLGNTPRGSGYPIFKHSGFKNHTLTGFWDQSLVVHGMPLDESAPQPGRQRALARSLQQAWGDRSHCKSGKDRNL